MGNSLEEMFWIFDVLDRWGLDEIESVLCPFCDAPNDVEVIDPEELQEEYCETETGESEISTRKQVLDRNIRDNYPLFTG